MEFPKRVLNVELEGSFDDEEDDGTITKCRIMSELMCVL